MRTAYQESKQYPVSFQKVFIFYLWQYYAMIYWSEKSVIKKRFNLQNNMAALVTISILVIFTVIIAYLLTLAPNDRVLIAFQVMLSSCHFWYDGFIWSVKKKDIK